MQEMEGGMRKVQQKYRMTIVIRFSHDNNCTNRFFVSVGEY